MHFEMHKISTYQEGYLRISIQFRAVTFTKEMLNRVSRIVYQYNAIIHDIH